MIDLEATDVDWTFGNGPTVTGPAEALLLSLAGHPPAVSDLSGDGLANLRSRLSV